ncbi:MAG: hypothetical protein V1708_05475 [Candidatus Micrarchaeota archaeon]
MTARRYVSAREAMLETMVESLRGKANSLFILNGYGRQYPEVVKSLREVCRRRKWNMAEIIKPYRGQGWKVDVPPQNIKTTGRNH